MKTAEQVVTAEKLAGAMKCTEEELAKAVAIAEVVPIAVEGGEYEFFYGEAFQVYAAAHLKKGLRLKARNIPVSKRSYTFASANSWRTRVDFPVWRGPNRKWDLSFNFFRISRMRGI